MEVIKIIVAQATREISVYLSASWPGNEVVSGTKPGRVRLNMSENVSVWSIIHRSNMKYPAMYVFHEGSTRTDRYMTSRGVVL